MSTSLSLFPVYEVTAFIEEVYVFFDGFFHVSEALVIACFEEMGEVCFGEVLVFAFKDFWEVTVGDFAFAHGFDDCLCDFVVAVCMAWSAVVNAGGAFVLPEPEVHFDHVFDVDEVTELFAVFDRGAVDVAPAAEKVGFSCFFDLVVKLVVDGGHLAFMMFLRAVDIEVFEAYDLALGIWHDLTDVAVEGQFGECVRIQRIFTFVAFPESMETASVGGGRGCIEEGNAMAHAEVQERFGVFIVRAHHEVHVVFHGVGACPFVEDYIDIGAVEVVVFDGFEEIIFVLIVQELESSKVFVILAVFQVIYDEDVCTSLSVQCFDNVAADESGAPCYDNHYDCLLENCAAAACSLPDSPQNF